jgi:hypothetical protein
VVITMMMMVVVSISEARPDDLHENAPGLVPRPVEDSDELRSKLLQGAVGVV